MISLMLFSVLLSFSLSSSFFLFFVVTFGLGCQRRIITGNCRFDHRIRITGKLWYVRRLHHHRKTSCGNHRGCCNTSCCNFFPRKEFFDFSFFFSYYHTFQISTYEIQYCSQQSSRRNIRVIYILTHKKTVN